MLKINSLEPEKTDSRNLIYLGISMDQDDIITEKRTTLMVKNIPNKYTLQMIIDLLNEELEGSYNFINCPTDLKVIFLIQNNCNIGYFFINFVDKHKMY